jgi:hypothetical protein
MRNNNYLIKSIERKLQYVSGLQFFYIVLFAGVVYLSRKQEQALSTFFGNLFSPFPVVSYGTGFVTLSIAQFLANRERYFEGAFLLFIWIMGWCAIAFTRIKRKKLNLSNRNFA